jgi:hypothetical protein
MKRKALKAVGDVLHPGKAWIIISDEEPGGYWDSSSLERSKASLIKMGYSVEELEIDIASIPSEGNRWPNMWLEEI